MPWYPNDGKRGLEWWNGSLDIPNMPKDTRNKLYPRLLKNWRNSSANWYSMNPTSYTPEYTDSQVDTVRDITKAQTDNVSKEVSPQFDSVGTYNAPAQGAMQDKLAGNQQEGMALSESAIRNDQERKQYNDWLRWTATAAERKDKQDELNIANSNLDFQNEMGQRNSPAGTDWMSLLTTGLGALGSMTQPSMYPQGAAGDPYSNWGGGGGGGLGELGKKAVGMWGMQGMPGLGAAAKGLGSLGSAAWSGLQGLGSGAAAGLGWLAGLL